MREKKVKLFQIEGGRTVREGPLWASIHWEAPRMSDQVLEAMGAVYLMQTKEYRAEVPFYRWLDIKRVGTRRGDNR